MGCCGEGAACDGLGRQCATTCDVCDHLRHFAEAAGKVSATGIGYGPRWCCRWARDFAFRFIRWSTVVGRRLSGATLGAILAWGAFSAYFHRPVSAGWRRPSSCSAEACPAALGRWASRSGILVFNEGLRNLAALMPKTSRRWAPCRHWRETSVIFADTGSGFLVSRRGLTAASTRGLRC